MAKNTDLQTTAKIDVDLLDVISADELFDLDQVVEPLKEIDTYLGRDVILRNPKAMVSPKGDKYFIFDVTDIATGESWKSSCGHWFMMEYIKKVEEKGLPVFPLGVNFYRDGQSIKFKGINKQKKQMRLPTSGNGDNPF